MLENLNHKTSKFWKPDTCLDFAKTTLLKWVLFDLLCIETIFLSFSNLSFFFVCVNQTYMI